MYIEYAAPLGRAWDRMKTALFKPFDLRKWFIVGFTAFLAALGEGSGPRSFGSGNGGGHSDFGDIFRAPGIAWDWLVDNPGWFALIIAVGIFLFAIGILITWLSSRGKFMLLDNVVNDRAEIAKPWKQYRMHGNSLFLWRLVFGLICFAIIISLILYFFVGAGVRYYDSDPHRVPVGFIIEMVFLCFLFILIAGYVSTFLDSFVIPIMYKHNLKTMQGWGRFMKIFGKYPFHFVFYGIFLFLLLILVVISALLFGLLTCLIGFILLIIPYINSVVTLPVAYTLRAFSVEYLAQFGDDYNVFPTAGKKAAAPAQ